MSDERKVTLTLGQARRSFDCCVSIPPDCEHCPLKDFRGARSMVRDWTCRDVVRDQVRRWLDFAKEADSDLIEDEHLAGEVLFETDDFQMLYQYMDRETDSAVIRAIFTDGTEETCRAELDEDNHRMVIIADEESVRIRKAFGITGGNHENICQTED